MKSEWPTKTLGNLAKELGAEIKTGPFGTKLKAAEYSTIGAPMISVKEIGFGQISIDEKTPRIPDDVVARMPEYLLELGDVVFARKGGIDRSAWVGEDEAGYFLGSDALRVRLPNSIDSRFVAYQARSAQMRAWLMQHSTGSTMPSLSGRVLALFPVVLPPLPEQRRIVAVLGALDDKIELNRQMNQTLEEIAQAIFKSRFVDFDGHDDLVDSELGPIPRGWEAGTLGDVAKNYRETVQPAELADDYPYVGLADMPEGSITLSQWGRAAEVSSAKARFDSGDFLFGRLRPYFKKVGIAPVSGVCSSDILVVRPKDDLYSSYVLCALTYDPFIAFATSVSTGTRMPRVSWKSMAGYGLAIPSRQEAERFEKATAPLLARVVANLHESRTLADIRDALLPKLISGEVRVPEAEEAVEAVT